MKLYVSKNVIESLLTPLYYLQEDDPNAIDLDLSDRGIVVELTQKYIAPYFRGYDKTSQETVKRSLSYYMISGNLHMDKFFSDFLLQFIPPQNTKDFLGAIWFALFENESLTSCSMDDYEVNSNFTPLFRNRN